MTKFILIRHGKAEMSGEDHLRKLDDDGLVQANSLCKKLLNIFTGNVKIYSSPFVRAVQTIKPFADKIGQEIKLCEELKEIKMGKSEKLSKHEIIKKMWEDENFKTENGVSQSENYKDIKPFLSNLFENNNQDNVILVTHGNLLGIIIKHYFKKNFGFDEWKIMSMPDLYELSYEADKEVSLKRNVNDIEKIFYIK